MTFLELITESDELIETLLSTLSDVSDPEVKTNGMTSERFVHFSVDDLDGLFDVSLYLDRDDEVDTYIKYNGCPVTVGFANNQDDILTSVRSEGTYKTIVDTITHFFPNAQPFAQQ